MVIILFSGLQQVVSHDKNDQYNIVKDGFEEYLQFISDSNWEGIGEKIYPGIFSIVEREYLIEAFKGIQSQGFWMRFGPIEKFDLTELQNDIPDEVNELFFGRYETTVYLPLDKDLEFSNEDVDKLEAILALNPKYSDMSFDSEKREFSIKSSSSLIAVRTEKWYYLEIEPNQLGTIEAILSEKISDQTP